MSPIFHLRHQPSLTTRSFSPNAGAGITLFFPLNSWSTYESAEDWVTTTGFPAILRAEMVITTLNAATDIFRTPSTLYPPHTSLRLS